MTKLVTSVIGLRYLVLMFSFFALRALAGPPQFTDTTQSGNYTVGPINLTAIDYSNYLQPQGVPVPVPSAFDPGAYIDISASVQISSNIGIGTNGYVTGNLYASDGTYVASTCAFSSNPQVSFGQGSQAADFGDITGLLETLPDGAYTFYAYVTPYFKLGVGERHCRKTLCRSLTLTFLLT